MDFGFRTFAESIKSAIRHTEPLTPFSGIGIVHPAVVGWQLVFRVIVVVAEGNKHRHTGKSSF